MVVLQINAVQFYCGCSFHFAATATTWESSALTLDGFHASHVNYSSYLAVTAVCDVVVACYWFKPACLGT